jgi:hypothetical protein
MNIMSTKMFSTENLEVLKSLVKANGNDADLGEKIRNLFRTDSFVTSMPNDYTLGGEIRKSINNI